MTRTTRRATLLSTAVAFLPAVFYVACGGDAETVADVDGGGDQDSGLVDRTTTGDTSTADSTLGDTSTGEDTGTGDTGTTDAAGDTNVTDTGTGGDATLLEDSGGAFNDAGPGGDAAVLNCGSAQCNLPAQTCCMYPVTFPPPAFYGACSNGNSCPALTADAGVGDAGRATELQCEVQENCTGGTVCCIQGPASDGGGGGKITSHCLSAGACATQVSFIVIDAGIPDAGDDADAGDAAPVLLDGGFTVSPRALLCNPAAADSGCGALDAGACTNANIGTWNLPNGFGTCGGIMR